MTMISSASPKNSMSSSQHIVLKRKQRFSEVTQPGLTPQSFRS